MLRTLRRSYLNRAVYRLEDYSHHFTPSLSSSSATDKTIMMLTKYVFFFCTLFLAAHVVAMDVPEKRQGQYTLALFDQHDYSNFHLILSGSVNSVVNSLTSGAGSIASQATSGAGSIATDATCQSRFPSVYSCCQF